GGRGRVKDSVLEQERVARVQAQVAHLHALGVYLPFGDAQRLGSQVRAARQQGHARVGPVKVGQAVTDFDADARQMPVPQVLRDAYVAVPTAAEGGRAFTDRSLVDQRRRVEVYVWAEQLHDERHGRGVCDQLAQGLLAEQSRTKVEVVVLGLARHFRLPQESLREAVARGQQFLDLPAAERATHDEKAVRVEGLSLLQL